MIFYEIPLSLSLYLQFVNKSLLWKGASDDFHKGFLSLYFTIYLQVIGKWKMTNLGNLSVIANYSAMQSIVSSEASMV